MKFRLPPNAFPPVSLSHDEKRWLRDEMNAVVAETMRAERQYVDPLDGRAVFPKSHWKAVRSRDDFAVYKERRAKRPTARSGDALSSSRVHAPMAHLDQSRGYSVDSLRSDDMPSKPEPMSVRSTSTGSGAWTSSSGDDPDSIVASMKEPHVPMLVAAGTVDGTLDDTMFGALAGDDLAWRMRTNYVKDKFADARILAKIDSPTLEDPFRSLCVKWFTKEVPALVGSFIQRRDFLILEATGSGVESDGTRFGFYMLHSIKLPGVPELSDLNVIRCKVSLCFISRERSPRSSHLFARGFSDARGEMIESVGVALTAESIIAAALVVECATVKKLTWLMQKQQRTRQQRIQRTASAALPSDCEACHRSLQKFSLSKHLHACQACGILVCAKCTVQKRLVVDVVADGNVVERQLTFCFGCVMESKRTSSWEVASDLQLAEHKRRQSTQYHQHQTQSQTQSQMQRQRDTFSQSQRPRDTFSQSQRQAASVQKIAPPRPAKARAQSENVDFSMSRSSNIFSSSMRTSTDFAASSSNVDTTRRTIVRTHPSKSVAGVGVVLY